MLGGSLGSTYGKAIGSDEGIKLVSTGGKVFVTILVNVDRITLGIDVEIEMGSLDGYFDGSNDGKFDGSFLGELHGSYDVFEVRATDC